MCDLGLLTVPMARMGFRRMTDRIRIELLLAAALLVYVNALPNGFTFDDGFYILESHAVKTFSLTGFFQPTPVNNIFRPLTFATFAVNWLLGGAHPFGYHLVNVLLHAAVTLLLYLVLRTLLEAVSGAETISFAAALLFAVHPIHTEAVASIVGRAELLAAGFLLGAWLLHLRDHPAWALGCFALALLSKESAVVFLPLVLAGDYARQKFKPFSRYGWIVGFTVLYVGLLWKVQGGRFEKGPYTFLDNPLANLPAILRILNALRIAWKYIYLQAYPATLSYDYSYNAILLYANLRHTLPYAILAALVILMWAWAAWAKRTTWMLAGAIYMAAFAATANILVSTGTIMGERLAYLPSAGFCLLVTAVWFELGKRKQLAGWVLLGVIVAALGIRTLVRNPNWKDNFTLFFKDLSAVPGSARAHKNLGDEYLHRGQAEEAVKQYQTAVRIYTNFPEAIENYGLAEARLGNKPEARRLLEDALSQTSKTSPYYDVVKVNLARYLMVLGEADEASKLLNEAIANSPSYALGWSSRAAIRYERGDVASARSDAETALRLDPNNSQAQALLKSLSAPNRSTPAN
jgi:protein O-mannosyl-transferase